MSNKYCYVDLKQTQYSSNLSQNKVGYSEYKSLSDAGNCAN